MKGWNNFLTLIHRQCRERMKFLTNKKAPDFRSFKNGVKDGARTRDLQNHNLAF